MVCDGCRSVTHVACANLTCLPVGFWYCENCTKRITSGEWRDVTVDLPLMAYVFERAPPPPE